jgi:hypothetical protein
VKNSDLKVSNYNCSVVGRTLYLLNAYIPIFATNSGEKFDPYSHLNFLDVDECIRGKTCQGKCINTLGSYRCECGAGLQQGYDKNSCQGKYLSFFPCSCCYMANITFALGLRVSCADQDRLHHFHDFVP